MKKYLILAINENIQIGKMIINSQEMKILISLDVSYKDKYYELFKHLINNLKKQYDISISKNDDDLEVSFKETLFIRAMLEQLYIKANLGLRDLDTLDN